MLFFNYVNIRVEKNILINLSNRLLDSYLSRTYLFHISNNPNNLINSIISETQRGLAFIFTIINLTRECLVLIILLFSNYKDNNEGIRFIMKITSPIKLNSFPNKILLNRKIHFSSSIIKNS